MSMILTPQYGVSNNWSLVFSTSGYLEYFILHHHNMTDAVVNWESLVHKNVRSKDGEGAGST